MWVKREDRNSRHRGSTTKRRRRGCGEIRNVFPYPFTDSKVISEWGWYVSDVTGTLRRRSGR